MAPEQLSSVQLRERDKRIEEKYQKIIAEYARKVERQRTSYNDIQRQFFELENSIDTLAKGLGFNNAFEAQLEVDTTELEGGFKGCVEKVASLKRELSYERDEKEMLVMEAEQEKSKLRAELEKVTQERDAEVIEARHIRKEYEDLQSKYDQLEDKRQRAAERYKLDYKKWKVFHDWLVDDDDPEAPPLALVKDFNFEDRKKYLGRIAKKKKVAVQAGVDYPKPDRFEWEDVPDRVEENKVANPRKETTPAPEHMIQPKEEPSSPTALEYPQPQAGPSRISTPKTSRVSEPSSSPTIFNTSSTAKAISTHKVPIPPIPNTRSTTVVSSTPATPKPFISSENPKPARIHRVFPLQGLSSTAAASGSSSTTTTPKANPTSSSRIPLSFEPMLSIERKVKVKRESQSSPKPPPAPLHVTIPSWMGRDTEAAVPNSSDTEDDSQAPPLLPTFPSAEKVALFPMNYNNDIPTKPEKAIIEYTRGSSETEDDSQAPPTFTAAPVALTSRRPLQPTPIQADRIKNKRRNSDSILPRLSQEYDEPSRPMKVRKISGIEFTHRGLMNEGKENVMPPQQTPRDRGVQRKKGVMSTVKGKQKALWNGMEMKGEAKTPITARHVGQKRLDDYSAYKGRGRYAKNVDKSADKTINSMFVVDAEKNGGVEHAYDEVVRNKEQRKKMEATDCECCRDYYEAVGPLPPRLQGPLWGTPSPKRCRKHLGINSEPPSPTADRTARHHNHTTSSEIASHKATISRHRQTWARAATPPNYWNIGFPDTQEVEDINERAMEMHRNKLKQVEREANSGEGRWKKR